uniref:Uncharacterized protein n=1 Tax=Tanacetum cinerariifolium TaxID=118510 RepID=A0A6L2J783_TANCI|nr:hypothetical protein [Tanacetum cinerariifolium]
MSRHTRANYVGTILTMIMIVHHGSRLSMSRNHATIKTLEKTIPLRNIISQLPSSILTNTSPPVVPIEDLEDSLIMGDKDLNTILKKGTDEVIKSSVEDFVPIPSEYEDTSESDSECDLPTCDDFSPIDVPEGKSVTFSNPLFDSNDDFTSSDDESLFDEDVSKDNVKIYSNPLFEFDNEYITSDVNPLFDELLENTENMNSYDSNLDEPALLESYYDSEGDVLYLESFLSDGTTPNLPPEVFLDRDPRNLSDINDLKIMVKVFDPGIPEKCFSPTYCGNILIYETCLKCNSRTGNSFTYDTIPESFEEVQIIPNPPPQCHFNIYLCQICEAILTMCGNSLNDFFCHLCTCEFCGNGAHVGYNCPTQVPSFQTLPSFPQQYPCCEDCEGLPEAGHCQPQQYTVNHSIFNAHNDLLNSQTKLMKQMTSMCKMVGQFIQMKHEEEQANDARYWKIPACFDDDDVYNFAITPNEPVDSLSMGDEHLNTILETESDEFIKSSAENLVPNPSESEGEKECDVPACFTTFSNILFNADYDFYFVNDQSLSDEDFSKEIYSNPLFDEEIISMKINPHHFNDESDLIESLLNHDFSIIYSSFKIDSLFEEYASKLTLFKSIPPRIDKTDCYPKEETHFTKRLLYDNSSLCPSEEFVSENSNADIESFSPSPIPVEDTDSLMKETDFYFMSDDPMPPGIEEDDYDSERDILILEELLDNYFLSLPENESFHFDISSSSRPHVKPRDGNIGILNIKMMGDIFEQKVPMPGLMIPHVSNQEKSLDLLSHQGLEIFWPSDECPMMIHGNNTPILDVPLFHFYPFDQLKYGGIRSS